jgi:hypothetical protein
MPLFLLRALCIAKVVSTDVKLLCSLSGKPDNKGRIDGQYTYKRKTEGAFASPIVVAKQYVLHLPSVFCL